MDLVRGGGRGTEIGMYIPPHFHAGDRGELVELMRRHAFATVVTVGSDGVPFANHMPLLASGTADGRLVLLGHMARANPQWKHFDREALVVFNGPHAYVSPSLYEHGAPDARVPTWNYAAVHAYGRPRILDDGATARVLEQLVEENEAGREPRWTADMRAPARQAMLRAIVGFAVEVERVEGKLDQDDASTTSPRNSSGEASSCLWPAGVGRGCWPRRALQTIHKTEA